MVVKALVKIGGRSVVLENLRCEHQRLSFCCISCKADLVDDILHNLWMGDLYYPVLYAFNIYS